MNRSALLAALLCPMAASVLTLGGCSQIPRPTASVTGARIEGLTLDEARVVFDVKIDNPYAVGLPMVGLDYALASGGSEFLTGDAALSGEVPADGSRTIQIPARVAFGPLGNVLQSARPGKLVPYRADLGLTFDPPIISEVSVQEIRWTSLSLSSVSGTMKVRLKNTAEYRYRIGSMNYSLDLSGQRVTSAATSNTLNLAPGASGDLSIGVSFSATSLGMAFLNTLTTASASYRLQGAASVTTDFGPVTIPFDASGQASMFN
jgi:LEA14-like dessication related protein